MNFENLVGNNQIKQLLIHSVSTSNLLHSYMFVGIDGIGKCLFAKEFAKLVLNSSQGTNDLQELSNHPDFMLIQPEDGKSIKIEQIRYLQEKIAEKPIASNKKIYIINDSDTMTQEAQNCLLKTLEEPPEYAIIILVLSNENKLLPTIKSRCTKIVFGPISREEMIQYFSSNHMDTPTETMLKLCHGSIGKAIQMQEEALQYEKVDTILENIEQADMIDVWNNSDILYNSKDVVQNLLEYINILLLDKLKQTNDMRYARMY